MNDLSFSTAALIREATVALKTAVRKAFIELQIPLNTPYEIRPVSDLDNADEPIEREVWVRQVFPIKRAFRLMTERLTVKVSAKGAELVQDITLHPPDDNG